MSKGNWPDYNAHGVSTAASHGAQTGLNQTYGWGTESGSQFGDGGGYDSGVGNNSSDQDNYPYNAIAVPAAAAGKQQQLAAVPLAAADAAQKPAGASRASLGHYYVCGTAMLLGALAATQVRGRPRPQCVLSDTLAPDSVVSRPPPRDPLIRSLKLQSLAQPLRCYLILGHDAGTSRRVLMVSHSPCQPSAH